MLDILCIGDSKLDIFLRIPSNNPLFNLDKQKNELLIKYGEKINIEKYVFDIGGNASNTGIGMSRLGLNIGLFAEIGNDEFSDKILNKLKKENINIDNLIQTTNEKSSFSVILSYKGDRTIFQEDIKRSHKFNYSNINTKFIYLTSLAEIWDETYQKIYEFVKNTNTKLAFNPGVLQINKRDKCVIDIIELSNYLFVNKEEAEELLYGKELDLDIKNDKSLVKKLLFGLRGLGAKNVIITDSDNGSYVQDENNEIYYLKILNEEVVEKTGAGDSYTAGFLAAILNGLSITDAMVWGTINAASVVQKIGAQEGLMTKIELEEKIKSLKNFTPEKLI